MLNGEEGAQAETLTAEQKRSLYQGVAESQLAAWSKGSGFYYWNYKLLTDTVNTPGWIGWDAWDLGRCIAQDWFPSKSDSVGRKNRTKQRVISRTLRNDNAA